MKLSVENNVFNMLVSTQIKNNFILTEEEKLKLISLIPDSLSFTANCLKENDNKYYWDNGELIFNPYHSGQYSIFLYFLSRQALIKKENLLADKIYYLNKMMHSCDIYHGIELPDVFFYDHPLGTVLGRAEYGNYFIFQQNCTVGNNHNKYPKLGEYVWLFANTTVIGDTVIGNNVFISEGTYIKDEIIPNNTIVFGRSPNLVLKPKPSEYFYKASPFKIHKELIL